MQQEAFLCSRKTLTLKNKLMTFFLIIFLVIILIIGIIWFKAKTPK